MALALNNLKRVDMPLNKETKLKIISYLKSYNCLQIIGVWWEYLKPYNCMQTNDQVGIVALNLF